MIFGAGGVGLVAVMAAALTPVARVIGVVVSAGRLELASELGATHKMQQRHESSSHDSAHLRLEILK